MAKTGEDWTAAMAPSTGVLHTKIAQLEAENEKLLNDNANLKAENNHLKESYRNLVSKVAQAQQILRV